MNAYINGAVSEFFQMLETVFVFSAFKMLESLCCILFFEFCTYKDGLSFSTEEKHVSGCICL